MDHQTRGRIGSEQRLALLRTAGLLLLALVVTSLANAQSVVCRALWIDGYNNEYNQAKAVLPAATENPDECVVYVTRAADGSLYLQSNFKNADAEYPTKLATKQDYGLGTLLLNILYTDRPDSLEWERALKTHRSKVRYVLDQSLITSHGTFSIDLEDAGNVDVMFGQEAQPRHTVRLQTGQGPPEHVVEMAEHVYTRLSNTSPARLTSLLKERPFNGHDLRIVRLVDNTATDRAIEQAGLKAYVLDIGDRSAAAIEKALSTCAGKTVLPLGHFEDGAFAMADTRGRTVARVLLKDLQTFSRQYRFSLIPLGCEVGKASSGGPLDKFNTIVLVGNLGVAAKQANTLAFFDSLAGKDLRFVMPRSIETRNVANFDIDVTEAPTALVGTRASAKHITTLNVTLVPVVGTGAALSGASSSAPSK